MYQTAKAIVDMQEGLTLQTTVLLRERDMGDLTGMKWPVIRKEGDGIRPETVETSAS
jgi:broad specificity phosphatase PhoE